MGGTFDTANVCEWCGAPDADEVVDGDLLCEDCAMEAWDMDADEEED